MRLRLNLIKETDLARLFEFQDGVQVWIPRSVIKSTTKFPWTDLSKPQVCELNIEDWWWDQYEKRQEEL